MEMRKIGFLNSDGTTYITLPKGFGTKGNYVRIDFINDKKIELTLIE